MKHALLVGGSTSLAMHGYGHYVAAADREVHLYVNKPLPGWLHRLPTTSSFAVHGSKRLFRTPLPADVEAAVRDGSAAGYTIWPAGDRGLPLIVSTPERSILEMLYLVPTAESLHNASMIMEGLVSLRPTVVTGLLRDCASIKVKRLFFVLAERFGHAWLRRVDRSGIELGSGKRMLEKGGKLDPTYLITVSDDFHGDE